MTSHLSLAHESVVYDDLSCQLHVTYGHMLCVLRPIMVADVHGIRITFYPGQR